MTPSSLTAITARLDAEARKTTRIETRLARLMEHFGLDVRGTPAGPVPVPTPFPEIHHAER